MRRRENETAAQHVQAISRSGVFSDGQVQTRAFVRRSRRGATAVMQDVRLVVEEQHDIAPREAFPRATGRISPRVYKLSVILQKECHYVPYSYPHVDTATGATAEVYAQINKAAGKVRFLTAS